MHQLARANPGTWSAQGMPSQGRQWAIKTFLITGEREARHFFSQVARLDELQEAAPVPARRRSPEPACRDTDRLLSSSGKDPAFPLPRNRAGRRGDLVTATSASGRPGGRSGGLGRMLHNLDGIVG